MNFASPSPPHAIVTGYTGSLGGYLVRRLLEEGWKVTGVARRTDPELEKLEAFQSVVLDLATPVADGALFNLLKAEEPALFVHAAVHYGDPRTNTRSMSDIETTFRVNAHSAFLAFAEYCETEPGERICTFIPVNSDAMFHTTAVNAVYAASKAAFKVYAAGLAERCRTSSRCVATVTFGPLADKNKTNQLESLAEKRGVSLEALTAEYLRRSNPFLVIDELIDLEACYQCIETIVKLGKTANGMVCRLDGGSAGALI